MGVTLVPVEAADKPALWRELQDYIEGMTVYADIARVNGEFEYRPFESYWRDPNRWPFWCVTDGVRAGFALVIREDSGDYEMGEFYIRPSHRRTGIGLDFARQLLLRFPGTWILSEFAANEGAIAFWHRAIEGYTFTERSYVGGSGKERLEQRVTVPG